MSSTVVGAFTRKDVARGVRGLFAASLDDSWTQSWEMCKKEEIINYIKTNLNTCEPAAIMSTSRILAKFVILPKM